MPVFPSTVETVDEAVRLKYHDYKDLGLDDEIIIDEDLPFSLRKYIIFYFPNTTKKIIKAYQRNQAGKIRYLLCAWFADMLIDIKRSYFFPKEADEISLEDYPALGQHLFRERLEYLSIPYVHEPISPEMAYHLRFTYRRILKEAQVNENISQESWKTFLGLLKKAIIDTMEHYYKAYERSYLKDVPFIDEVNEGDIYTEEDYATYLKIWDEILLYNWYEHILQAIVASENQIFFQEKALKRIYNEEQKILNLSHEEIIAALRNIKSSEHLVPVTASDKDHDSPSFVEYVNLDTPLERIFWRIGSVRLEEFAEGLLAYDFIRNAKIRDVVSIFSTEKYGEEITRIPRLTVESIRIICLIFRRLKEYHTIQVSSLSRILQIVFVNRKGEHSTLGTIQTYLSDDSDIPYKYEKDVESLFNYSM